MEPSRYLNKPSKKISYWWELCTLNQAVWGRKERVPFIMSGLRTQEINRSYCSVVSFVNPQKTTFCLWPLASETCYSLSPFLWMWLTVFIFIQSHRFRNCMIGTDTLPRTCFRESVTTVCGWSVASSVDSMKSVKLKPNTAAGCGGFDLPPLFCLFPGPLAWTPETLPHSQPTTGAQTAGTTYRQTHRMRHVCIPAETNSSS